MTTPFAALLARTAPVLLDGGLATALRERGHDLADALWSARLLLDDPDEVIAAHRGFLAAGAQALITASYQLAARSLAQAGRDPGLEAPLVERSVVLARAAVTEHHRSHPETAPAVVAGSVGPFGAVLGAGAEYRGRYAVGVTDLEGFHRPRVRALVAAGADVLACETIPSGDELRALARVLDGCGTPAWVSLTVGAGGRVTPEGQPLAEAVAALTTVDEVVAVGVNCCAPERVAPALEELAVLGRAMVVYPNLGARFDVRAQDWRPAPLDDDVATTLLAAWRERGAQLIGGCCGTTTAGLATLGRQLARLA